MKLCSNCSRPVTPGSDIYVGTAVYPGMVVALFTCGCGGTYACNLYREPEEDDLLLAGEPRETANSLSDLRAEEAA